MSTIGIVAAMPGELHPLVREWPRTDHVYIGNVGGARCIAACEGMGAAAATRSFAAVRAAAEGQLDAIISYGWAGAISCGVKPPSVHSVSEVIDAGTGERYTTYGPRTAPGAPLRLVTSDHVVGPKEKRPLAERYQAVLVDMEAATVGRLARAHGIPFFCLRGISDGYTDDLPDFNRFITPAGKMRVARFAMHAMVRPTTWGPLINLGRQSREAAEALAREIPQVLSRANLIF